MEKENKYFVLYKENAEIHMREPIGANFYTVENLQEIGIEEEPAAIPYNSHRDWEEFDYLDVLM